MKEGLVLVDYDNFVDRRRPRRKWFDIFQVTRVMDRIVGGIKRARPELGEIDVRLYGGWVESSGRPSQMADQVSQGLPLARGRNQGVLVRPSLATSLLQFPSTVLRGTVRGPRGGRRQKMVDTMLGCDAMFAATNAGAHVIVTTGDDDLLPATITAHAASGVTWARPEDRTRPNDQLLRSLGLPVLIL